MSKLSSSSFLAPALALLVVSGAVLTWAGCQKDPGQQAGDRGQAPAGMDMAGGKGRILFYRSPMNPSQTSPVPARDSMGMDYLPVYERDISGAAAGPAGFAPITVDPQQRQLIGLKTVAAVRAPFAASLRTTGRVTYDETRVHHIHTRYDAYVENVYGDFTGKYVRKGEPLVSLYSPDLFIAEQEYLLALRARQASGGALAGAGGVDLLASARQKLLLWNISGADIDALERTGKPSQTLNIYAPVSGYIIAKIAIHGMRVKPEDSLFDMVDLSRLWVLADIYEYELPRVEIGQAATMTLPYWPGRSWQGRVTYIFPSVDPRTRTIKVRLEIANPKNELKAEMFADVVIAVAPRMALVVPDDAVLDTGTRKLVFVVLGEGRLQPREIATLDHDHAGGRYEVRSGLAEGELVAKGASFLLDSESRLQAALSETAPARASSPSPPDGGTGDAQRQGK